MAFRLPVLCRHHKHLRRNHICFLSAPGYYVKRSIAPYRDATWAMVIAGIDPNPANNDIISDWARNYWQALHPYSAGGAYINFMMEEGEDRVIATYGDNYEKLTAIKAKYDPGNLFRVNQNIKPKIKKPAAV